MVLHAGVNLVGMCVLPATLPTPQGNNCESETGALWRLTKAVACSMLHAYPFASKGNSIKGRTCPAAVQCSHRYHAS